MIPEYNDSNYNPTSYSGGSGADFGSSYTPDNRPGSIQNQLSAFEGMRNKNKKDPMSSASQYFSFNFGKGSPLGAPVNSPLSGPASEGPTVASSTPQQTRPTYSFSSPTNLGQPQSTLNRFGSPFAGAGATQQEEQLAEQNRFAEDSSGLLGGVMGDIRSRMGGYAAPPSAAANTVTRLDGSTANYDDYRKERRSRSPGPTTKFMEPVLGGGNLNTLSGPTSANNFRSYEDRQSLTNRNYMDPYSTGY